MYVNLQGILRSYDLPLEVWRLDIEPMSSLQFSDSYDLINFLMFVKRKRSRRKNVDHRIKGGWKVCTSVETVQITSDRNDMICYDESHFTACIC